MPDGGLHNLLVSATTLVLLATFYASSTQSPSLLSPQGCRMSYMSPSYLLQTNFNATWTRLSRRYSLWLYREEGWESQDQLTGVPVLFIPGNAGSSRQVRSIASSATRQYYAEPGRPHPDFLSRGIKQLDFFTADFNEDFSALHGPTLLSERSYTSAAIKYILSLYPPGTKIILMGHSMGGIVASSLLPSSEVSAVITMSTPHSLPPARLDRRIEEIYSNSWAALRNDSTPILSICGGATDLMIPSETCSMKHSGPTLGWRKTLFTSCMEGTWTGVGHREMVWCHQVRWRVARAALELGVASGDAQKGAVLDHWFRDGIEDYLVDHLPVVPDDIPLTHIPSGHRLTLHNPPRLSHMYMLPLNLAQQNMRFTLYVGRGAVTSMSPYHSSDLVVAAYRCRSAHRNCRPLQPRVVKLIPSTPWGAQFPVPGEGVDESDGVVFFEALLDLSTVNDATDEWIGVTVRGGGMPRTWVVAGIDTEHVVWSNVSRIDPLQSTITIPVDPAPLLTKIQVSNALLHSLLVYRVVPSIAGTCSDVLLAPLLLHSSSPAESHFHPMDGKRPLLLHSHTHGPFIDSLTRNHGLNFTIHSSGECGVRQLELTVDWWTTLATWGLRYWTTICAWAVGVVGVVIFQAWSAWEKGGTFPSVSVSLTRYISLALVPLSGIISLVSFLPLGSSFFLGNSGEFILVPLAPLLLFAASGSVVISWHFLQGIMWFLYNIALPFGRIRDETPTLKRTIWSLGIIIVLVATVIPSQVAFLVCFLIHLFTCAVQSPTSATSPAHVEAHAQKTHILLLLFWLLPLVAPVLAVWVRTLATAGLTTPFDGDHDVFAIVMFLLLVDFASSSTVPFFNRASSRFERRTAMAVLCSLAFFPFALGGRYTYWVYAISNMTVTYLVVERMTGTIRLRPWRAAQ